MVDGNIPLWETVAKCWLMGTSRHRTWDWLSRLRGLFMSYCKISTAWWRWSIISVDNAWERTVSRKDTMSMCRNLFLPIVTSCVVCYENLNDLEKKDTFCYSYHTVYTSWKDNMESAQQNCFIILIQHNKWQTQTSENGKTAKRCLQKKG